MQRQDQKLLSEKNLVQYKLVKLIGSGTFGKVYMAKGQKDTFFAIKNVLQDKKYKNRQLQITKLLNHPNIVHLEHYFYQKQNNEEYLNLVIQYVPDTLSRIIKTNKKEGKFLHPEIIRTYSYQLFKGLSYLNKINVCHRDIKPPNILIGQKNQLKICDFGSAKSLVQGQKNIAYICSRYYRAPELIFGSTNYTNQIDIWSAGCVIAEMITNRVIFQGESSTDQLLKIIKMIGSPSIEDIYKMNVFQLKFQLPKIKAYSLSKYFLKYNPNANPQLIQLLNKIFVYDPTKRLTPQLALLDPYFKPLRQSQLKK